MKKQIIIILSVDSVNEEIHNLIHQYLINNNINAELTELFYESLIESVVLKILTNGIDYNKINNNTHDLISIALADLGNTLEMWLYPLISIHISTTTKQIKIMVSNAEVIIVKKY